MSYETFKANVDALVRKEYSLFSLEEAHHIKNEHPEISVAVRKTKARIVN